MRSFDLTAENADPGLDGEWLAVNHIGGYASSTVTGLNSRKYHGLLVAAMTPPVNRMVLLSRVEETVLCDGWRHDLACSEYPGAIHPRGDQLLRAFSADPFPRWAYQGTGWTIEKSVRLLSGANTVVVSYTLLGGTSPVELHLRPMLALRGIHELMYQWNRPMAVDRRDNGSYRVPATGKTPEVFFATGGVFEAEPQWFLNTIYRRESERGYCGLEDVWSPGLVRWALTPGQTAYFVFSADPVDYAASVDEAERSALASMVPGPLGETWGEPLDTLRRAAGQFVLSVPRIEAANANRDAVMPCDFVVSEYPWSPPSPRQSLIALDGLLLGTGRRDAAVGLLRSLADRIKGGLVPSIFGEQDLLPVYDGADVSLWFVQAVGLTLETADVGVIESRPLWSAVREIIDQYRAGATLGISVDTDHLLRCGSYTHPVTWMNACADGKALTPRVGKPVEINALWYNALCVGATLAGRFGCPELADEWTAEARRVKASFNARFWNEAARCCHDVVDVASASINDATLRPNQIFAGSLPHAVLDVDRLPLMLETVKGHLLTPMGVRTLSPTDRRYQGTYRGGPVSRDAARHNGCVFPWLLGPLVRLHLRVHGRAEDSRHEASNYLDGCVQYLCGPGLGQLCEMFDGNRPHRPAGAMASSAAVGQLLGAWMDAVHGVRFSTSPTPPFSVEAVRPTRA